MIDKITKNAVMKSTATVINGKWCDDYLAAGEKSGVLFSKMTLKMWIYCKKVVLL